MTDWRSKAESMTSILATSVLSADGHLPTSGPLVLRYSEFLKLNEPKYVVFEIGCAVDSALHDLFPEFPPRLFLAKKLQRLHEWGELNEKDFEAFDLIRNAWRCVKHPRDCPGFKVDEKASLQYLLLFAAFIVWCAERERAQPTARIRAVNYDVAGWDEDEDSEQMEIYVDFDLHNLRAKTGYCIAAFYYVLSDGRITELEDENGKWVTIASPFTPHWRDTDLNRFPLALPYDWLDDAVLLGEIGRHDLAFDVTILDNASRVLARSARYFWTHSLNDDLDDEDFEDDE